ncbi:MAG: WXG100 family type VII secretion target [Micromonosporaceae bacterium]|nr:WXG100 family type VII secretion target [Micromonosporaceae bacterium]
MATDITSHDGSRTALIQAFSTASSDQQQAFTTVTNAEAALASQWKGSASALYRDAMRNWVAGLQKVRAGLGEIESAMVDLGKQSATTEDDNLVTSNWFDPDSQPTASWT